MEFRTLAKAIIVFSVVVILLVGGIPLINKLKDSFLGLLGIGEEEDIVKPEKPEEELIEEGKWCNCNYYDSKIILCELYDSLTFKDECENGCFYAEKEDKKCRDLEQSEGAGAMRTFNRISTQLYDPSIKITKKGFLFWEEEIVYTGPSVYDFLGILNQNEVDEIDGEIEQAKKERNVDITLTILETATPFKERRFANILFNQWGVGERGILILLLIKEKKIIIEFSYDIEGEGIFTDGDAGQVLQDNLHFFDEGLYKKGLSGIIGGIKRKLVEEFQVTPTVSVSYKYRVEPGERSGATIDRIILHHTGGSTFMSAYYTFKNSGGSLSSHYIIDRDGTIYSLIDESKRANHAKCWNYRSIGIEIVNTGKADMQFTDAQYDSIKNLISDIASRWPSIEVDHEHVMAHYQTTDIGTCEVDISKWDPSPNFDWARIGLAPHTLVADVGRTAPEELGWA